jgi:hypothetical protein
MNPLQVPRFLPNLTFNHTFRWSDIRTNSTPGGEFPITPAALCAAAGFLGVSATNVFPQFSAIRVRRIKMWAVLPNGLTLTGGDSYISVSFTKTVNGTAITGAGSQEFAVPVISPSNIAKLDVRPPSQWLAANWVGQNDANTFFYLRTIPGTTIEIDLQCTMIDGTGVSSYTVGAGTLNSQGFFCLDSSSAAGSRVLFPIGASNVYS